MNEPQVEQRVFAADTEWSGLSICRDLTWEKDTIRTGGEEGFGSKAPWSYRHLVISRRNEGVKKSVCRKLFM
jgi:hypothetical protein